MKTQGWKGIAKVIIAGVAIAALTGCGGLGIASNLEIYRVDKRAQESKTYERNNRGLRCLFFDCKAQDGESVREK